MASIEKEIKNQYAKVFKQSDWESFKLIAEYYLTKAATIKRKDIEVSDAFKLLLRISRNDFFLVSELEAEDTFPLSPLIDNLKKVITFSDWATIEKGLKIKILKVFRNKEGHVAVLWHKYNAQNYRDMESAMTLFYKEAFGEEIEFKIFMEETDNGVFKINE